MKQKLIKRPCPTCKTSIGVGLFSNREEIIRCPKCGELLIDNPKRKQIGLLIFLLGILVWIGFHYWLGISSLWLYSIIIVSLLISFLISDLTIIEKDFVIRNKQTNKISYCNKSDWDEILKKSSDKENIFEIIEELR